MAEKVELVEEVKTLSDKVVELGRDSLYMGLGVVSVVQENVQGLVKRGKDYRHTLIERGEKMAKDNKGRVNELVEMPQTMAKDTVKKASDTFEKYSEQVLTRVHVPTSDQIEAMTKKVHSVERKLDKVIKENAAAQ
ncbi:phasin family protein [Promineifilum sp.]|uniref:phasin family protein n=1 Tax=Promineifilum sp. TaxID=2664178 RepID=UPI0035AFE678